uniref:Uncharacterized protein n=1 Tax=Anguilla anguilla TaxID=7936 RepID=A0A0E9PHW1_ANGAN
MFISTVLGYCHMSRVAYWHSSSLSVLLHLLRQRFQENNLQQEQRLSFLCE